MADILTPYVKFLRGSPTAFGNLQHKDSDTLYFVHEEGQSVGQLWIGDKLITSSTNEEGIVDYLSELKDVDTSGVKNGQVLSWNQELQKWVPVFINSGQSIQIFDSIYPEKNQTHLEAIEEATKDLSINNGDIAIVKDNISGDKYQYTSYIFNNNYWKAMDNNYNAENIYFDEDIVITKEVGNIELVNGKGIIPSQGKNLKEVFESIWKKEDLEISIELPKLELDLEPKIIKQEVGTNFIRPVATLKINSLGSYEYGSRDENYNFHEKEDTGIIFNSLKIGNNDLTYTEISNIEYGIDEYIQYELTEDNIPNNIVTDEKQEYSFLGHGSYDLSPYKPQTNLENLLENGEYDNLNKIFTATSTTDDYSLAVGNIESGEVNLNNIKFIVEGYRAPFWGYKLTNESLNDPTLITSEQIRSLGNKGLDYNNVPNKIVAPKDTKQLYFCVKAGVYSNLEIINSNALNSPVACSKIEPGVNVFGANGYEEALYDVWYVNLDYAFDSDQNLKLNWII